MKKIFLFAFCGLMSLYFISCDYICKGKYQCDEGILSLYSVGFTGAEVDSSLQINYKADNNFDSVIETQISTNDSVRNDTSEGRWILYVGCDYEIIFPKVQDTFRITKMEVSGPTTELVPCGSQCPDNLSSFTINGQTFTDTIHVYYMVK